MVAGKCHINTSLVVVLVVPDDRLDVGLDGVSAEEDVQEFREISGARGPEPEPFHRA
jgi:hypothetical protein